MCFININDNDITLLVIINEAIRCHWYDDVYSCSVMYDNDDDDGVFDIWYSTIKILHHIDY